MLRSNVHRRRSAWRLVIAVAALTLGACSESTRPSTGVVSVSRIGDSLALHNAGNEPVYYFAWDRDQLPSVDWGQCAGPLCPSIQAREMKRIPLTYAGYRAGTTREIVFYWWTADPGPDDRPRPGSVHSILVTL